MAKLKPKPAEVKTQNIDALVEAFNGNADLLLFYVTWIKHGLNATKAYLEIHPDVTDHSARVLGSKVLAKISKEHLMAAYGLDVNAYFQQLKDGVHAVKWNDFTGEVQPDHATRRPYHDKLGRLLGLEQDKGNVLQQFNANEMSLEFVTKDAGSTT